MRIWLVLGVALAVIASGRPASASSLCAARLLAPATPATGKRMIAEKDLIELRDIGSPEPSSLGMPSRMSLSPDGLSVAFALLRANIAHNDYCIGIFVSRTTPGSRPRAVNIGGELRIESDRLRGYLVPSGAILPTIPLWSPDGRTLAFLRRDDGVTQLWVVHADGSEGHALTHATTDISVFRWSPDGRRLIFSTCPQVLGQQRAILQEARTGWHYDARVAPDFGAAPLTAAQIGTQLASIDVATARIGRVTPQERAAFPSDDAPGVAPLAVAKTVSGWTAQTRRLGASLLAPRGLVVTTPQGTELTCDKNWCRDGIAGFWWDDANGRLYVVHREGWNQEESVLYRWSPTSRVPTVVARTTDDWQDCGLARGGLVCTRETATRPRHIVEIDLTSGKVRDVFDPNPGFGAIILGKVVRLRASNALGLKSWADLVLPPDYRPGEKLPLVIVQYRSEGFLRGGTGDEYPIYLLAAHGFAVLSFERPPFVAAAYPDAKSAFEINAIILKDWAERRSVFGALCAELDLAIGTGAVDPGRIGITGLSDGASTVQFALANSTRFAAAAISTCCFEPRSVMTYGGTAFADYLRNMGFPGAIDQNDAFWRPMSIALAARRISTPLLLQLADREYLNALETFTALREANKPVDLYIFPDEYHVKWQPRHRLAIYERSIQWFDFWLRPRDVTTPRMTLMSDWDDMRRVAAAQKKP